MSLAPEHRRLEIGNTWLNPAAWGTGANTEAKYLLLRHAFEELGCLRVEFKTDALNERARAALAAIPSEFEGIHRWHMVARGDERRDSAWYAVTVETWPETRRALEARLAELDFAAPGIRYGTGAFDGQERQRDRSRPCGHGSCRAPAGARRRAARGRRRADAPLRAGHGHSGRGPGTVPGTRLDRTCLGSDAALRARPARAALLPAPAADVHARARARAARRRLGRGHGRDGRGAGDRPWSSRGRSG